MTKDEIIRYDERELIRQEIEKKVIMVKGTDIGYMTSDTIAFVEIKDVRQIFDNQKIKIFYLNEYEWWAGKSLESVIKFYKEHVNDDVEDFDSPYELSDKAIETLNFNRENGEVVTFKEELDTAIREGQKFPCLFATTES